MECYQKLLKQKVKLNQNIPKAAYFSQLTNLDFEKKIKLTHKIRRVKDLKSLNIENIKELRAASLKTLCKGKYSGLSNIYNFRFKLTAGHYLSRTYDAEMDILGKVLSLGLHKLSHLELNFQSMYQNNSKALVSIANALGSSSLPALKSLKIIIENSSAEMIAGLKLILENLGGSRFSPNLRKLNIQIGKSYFLTKNLGNPIGLSNVLKRNHRDLEDLRLVFDEIYSTNYFSMQNLYHGDLRKRFCNLKTFHLKMKENSFNDNLFIGFNDYFPVLKDLKLHIAFNEKWINTEIYQLGELIQNAHDNLSSVDYLFDFPILNDKGLKSFNEALSFKTKTNTTKFAIMFKDSGYITDKAMHELANCIAQRFPNMINLKFELEKCAKITTIPPSFISNTIQALHLRFNFNKRIMDQTIIDFKDELTNRRKLTELKHITLDFIACTNLSRNSLETILDLLILVKSIETIELNFAKNNDGLNFSLKASSDYYKTEFDRLNSWKLRIDDYTSSDNYIDILIPVTEILIKNLSNNMRCFDLELGSRTETTDSSIKSICEMLRGKQEKLEECSIKLGRTNKITKLSFICLEKMFAEGFTSLKNLRISIKNCNFYVHIVRLNLQDALLARKSKIKNLHLDI